MSKNKVDQVSFSLVQGGPLYQLFLLCRLIKPPFHPRLKLFVIPLIAWLPLLLLSLLSGFVTSGVNVPFLYDIDTNIRFLGSLTLLLIAEPIAHQFLQVIVRQFPERNIINAENQTQFTNAINSTNKLRNSIIIELFLIVIAFTGGHWLWREFTGIGVSSWYSPNQTSLTPAGYWYLFISIPIFQFLAFRWYFRMIVWYRFLWKVSRLPLQLNSLHPDRAGGIGFLAFSSFGFAPLLLAHTLLLAGVIVNRVWYTGAAITDFKFEAISIIVFLMVLVLAPLTFYIFHLSSAKRNDLEKYGIVASHYVNDFRQKWMMGSDAKKELLGSADIQSLADLANSYEVGVNMRIVPFGRNTLMALAVLLLLPLLPLIFMMLPFMDMMARMIKLVL